MRQRPPCPRAHLACLLIAVLAMPGMLAALGGQAPRLSGDGPAEPPLGEPPLGLPRALDEPEDNPFDPARWRLGRKFFFDPLLSADLGVACASCHRPEHGFADPAARSRGVRGELTERNTPSLLNRGFGERFMWDGRAASLEEQVLLPIENPVEMGLPLEQALERLAAHAEYPALFAAAFPGGLSRASLAQALSQYVRRLYSGDSAVDRFRASAYAELSSEERVGLWVYESKGRCWRCHGGPNFTDEGFHSTGVGAVDGLPAPGRFAVTGDEADRGRFKTPSLRGAALSAPYMHDGSLSTLAEVVEFYRRGGNRSANLDPLLQPLELGEREAAALVAFLGALSRPGRLALEPLEPAPSEPAPR